MVPPFQGCWNTATNPGDFGRLRCRGIDIDHGPAPVVPVLVFNRRNAMALNLTQKKEVVAELAGVAGKAVSLVAAEYAGLTVGQLTDMRKKARDSVVYLKVAKNTLVSRAIVGNDYTCVDSALVGPLLYAFSHADPGAAGRMLKAFAKSNEKPQQKNQK